jgi:predicted Rossmann fold nucleotide-binding protein DprA/Smf involved in DNA uptake
MTGEPNKDNSVNYNVKKENIRTSNNINSDAKKRVESDKKRRKTEIDNLSDKEQKVFELLSLMPTYIDDVIVKSGYSVTLTISILSVLERKGLINQPLPGYFSKIF